jgi:hypothetical protein
MTLLIDILLLVLILFASSLCIFAIIYLKRTFEQIEAIRKDIHQFVENTMPTLNNLEEITQRTKRIVCEAEGYWEEIDHSIRFLREKILNFGLWKKINYAKTQRSYLINSLRSVAKGISAFWNKYKRT